MNTQAGDYWRRRRVPGARPITLGPLAGVDCSSARRFSRSAALIFSLDKEELDPAAKF